MSAGLDGFQLGLCDVGDPSADVAAAGLVHIAYDRARLWPRLPEPKGHAPVANVHGAPSAWEYVQPTADACG
jgi:hypothetical protein